MGKGWEIQSQGPLKGLKVLDLGLFGAGPFGPTILGELGADVIKVEMPGEGCILRRLPPFYQGVALGKFVELRNKKSITIDLHLEEGQKLIKELVKEYDVVIENYRPGRLEEWGLGYEDLKKVNPRVILVRVSGFGQTGPYNDRLSYDTVGAAMGGIIHLTGFSDGPPLPPGIILCDYASAGFNALAALIAVYYRERTGLGQWADIAQYETIFRLSEYTVAAYDKLGEVRTRTGNSHPGIAPGGLFETKEGQWIVIVAANDKTFARLARAIGKEELVKEPHFATIANRSRNAKAINQMVAGWAKKYTLVELSKLLEEIGVPFSQIYSIKDAFEDPHYQARNNIVALEDPTVGVIKVPNLAPKFSLTPGLVKDTGPELGQHNEEILSKLRESGQEIVRSGGSPTPDAQAGYEALAGLRILDIGPGIGGPFGATLLADFGAEVIKIEELKWGDPLRHIPPFYKGTSLWWAVDGRNKKSLSLDLRKKKGQEIFRRLVSISDIVIEGFCPGTLERWGLAYNELKKVNDKLIMLRVSGYGQSGPYSQRPAFDPIASAMGGLTFLTGSPDGPPVTPSISIASYFAGIFTAISIMAALYHRDKSGEGQWVDLALYEPLFRSSPRSVPVYDTLGTIPERMGANLPLTGAQVIYQTKDDKWVAILFPENKHFAKLARAMGREELTVDPRFNSLVQRFDNRDALNTLVAAWVRQMPADELVELLTDNELPVSLVYDIKDIFEDPHYNARGNIIEVEDPVLGKVKMQDVVPKLSLTPGKVKACGPSLGQHNLEILSDLMGYSLEELDPLKEEGII